MYKTAALDLPLHYGACPPWLFAKMKRLARAIIECIIIEKGPGQFLKKLSDPYFFQALGCVLAFDWHSSGLTTTVCGAIKEGLRGTGHELGLYVAGGKGKVSRKTPDEITTICDKLRFKPDRLIYASRMSAKVDSACVQDGYELYQHSFFFTASGEWTVIQQGMNLGTRYARRYHWYSRKIESFVCEPHSGVCCDKKAKSLNMVAEESKDCRNASASIVRRSAGFAVKELKRLKEKKLPARHKVLLSDINPERLSRVLLKAYQREPEDFESLVISEGIGAKTVRALSLISELVYNKPPSFKDPARFSYAHGGKDGYPYPVDRKVYESSISTLERAVRSAKIGRADKLKVLRKLAV